LGVSVFILFFSLRFLQINSEQISVVDGLVASRLRLDLFVLDSAADHFVDVLDLGDVVLRLVDVIEGRHGA